MELFRDLNPPPPGPRIDFWTPRNKQPERVVCLSTWLWAHHVHWLGSRTQPCTLKVGNDGEVTEHCEHCKAQCPIRWKGYLHVFRFTEQRGCFLCLTPVAGDELIKAMGQERNLRGLSFDVWRVGGNATAALCIRRNGSYERQEVRSDELDPAPFLKTVFRKNKPLSLPR